MTSTSQRIQETLEKLIAEEEERRRIEESELTDEDRVFNKLKYPPRTRTQILMPLIRSIAPGIIAQDIMGVQPMTQESGEIFKTVPKYDTDTKEEE